MTTASTCPSARLAIGELRTQFVGMMPRIERHARIYFHSIPCTHAIEDAVQETLSVAWKWFLRLAQRGKDATRFVGTLARYAARAVRSGRRLRGSESLRDILSRQAQKRHSFTVGSLPISTRVAMDDIYAVPGGQRELDEYEERLADNAKTPPPDAAAFRIDFPVFLNDLSDRDRKMAAMLSLGHTVKHVAREFGISPARVTQLRVDWCRDWYRRHGERAPIDSRHKESDLPCVA